MHNGALYTVVDSLRQRVTAGLKLADSRWDQRWVEPIVGVLLMTSLEDRYWSTGLDVR